ncbi:MAG: ATP-grasp domain-containing protein, partial [Pseudomonadota bacterium]|nr:ATP-grasp domain-containing protein [Pseudomonadota bacterium]
MSTPLQHTVKIGILGGGQLGRLLIQAGMNWNILFATLDPDKDAPCANISAFTHGELTDFNTVVNFGDSCDLITIEIENVNIAALRELVRRGKKVYPEPDMIELIQDKRRQKQYYQQQKIPTAEFVLTENREDVLQHKNLLPAVHKLATCGYDGRGVQIIKSADELHKAFDAPGVLERLVNFEKEIAVIVARNSNGEIVSFPPVEMVFHPEANLVEYLFS